MLRKDIDKYTTMKDRIQWIDIAKGIGIICVVIGHYYSTNPFIFSLRQYIYWFHMPLFFILSGLLYRQTSSFIKFASTRFLHLMIPYYLFFLLLHLDGIGNITIYTFVMEGPNFGTIWWFVPSLFCTQILSFFILKFRKKRFVLYCAFFGYIIAMIITMHYTEFFRQRPIVMLTLPLGMEIVPMGIVFYLMGYYLQPRCLSDRTISSKRLFTALGCGLSFFLLDFTKTVKLPLYSMGEKLYGYPVLNLIIPLIFFFTIRDLAIFFSKKSICAGFFSEVGKASMIIMFMNIPIMNLIFPDFIMALPPFVKVVAICKVGIAIFISYCIYLFFMQFSITRKLFLGIYKK